MKRLCPIQEILESEDSNVLDAKVNAFIRLEVLDSSPAYAKFQEKALEESGLIDEEVETILEMKKTFSAWRTSQSQKNSK